MKLLDKVMLKLGYVPKSDYDTLDRRNGWLRERVITLGDYLTECWEEHDLLLGMRVLDVSLEAGPYRIYKEGEEVVADLKAFGYPSPRRRLVVDLSSTALRLATEDFLRGKGEREFDLILEMLMRSLRRQLKDILKGEANARANYGRKA